MTDDPASADTARALAASLFAELIVGEQLANRLVTRSLPGGMQLSHFSVLNLLAHLNEERTPAQLAEAFHVGRSAMTNTLARLEWAGHVHVRPDWDDARRKWVAISPSGRWKSKSDRRMGPCRRAARPGQEGAAGAARSRWRDLFSGASAPAIAGPRRDVQPFQAGPL